MSTLVKNYGVQTARKCPPGGADKDIIRPLPAGKQQLLDESVPGGGRDSPKSVIRTHALCANSTCRYSCSSSSSAERATFVNSPQESAQPLHLVEQHNDCRDKPKQKAPRHEEYSVLVESNSQTEQLDGASNDHTNTQVMEGSYLSTHYMKFEFDPPSKLAVQSSLHQPHLLVSSATEACKSNKPHEACVPKSLSLTSKIEDVNSLKKVAPIDNLINTLMKQYQPSLVTEDGKPFRHPCLNQVLANVCNSGFNGDLVKPKFVACKWDEDEKWMRAKLSSTSAQILNNSTHKVPLFKLSHNEHSFPVSIEKESFSIQPSCNKVQEIQPCHVQTNTNMREKDILRNEVEKLSNAVSCAQACLDQIQPIPPPRAATNTAINPFLAQGVFQNRTYPMVTQGTLKPNSQVEPLITRGALRSSHAPATGSGGMELFWGSPVNADKQLSSSINTRSPGIQAPKEGLRPLATQVGIIKPSMKDAECKGDLRNSGEHLHIQKHEMRGGQALTMTSYMKDAATEITPTASHRDMGTQVTPLGSSRHQSPHRSPQKGRAMSPTRQNIPMRNHPAPVATGIIDMRRISPVEVERCHRAKLELQGVSAQAQVQHSLGTSFDSNWSSRQEEEEDIGKGLRHLDLEDLKRDVLDARATAWKEATRLKLLARYEREETQIQAWEDLQAAKAQADLKKLEMKLERKRIQMRTKIANRLDAAHRKAKERRVAAKAYRQEAMEKTCHRADEMLEEASLFQARYSLCACFSQSFG
ncbi:hypothetical protein GOP47_0014939 [Adiantum capillus-veneris]|uniref:Remorin C-terminal domain-containing protein n=1 Tax=Adiantum capillus-veneris TaxID=13818 RepID=A0A9D4UMG9_ADICA|nr:hypothetical protein GOP47_0014939 [Adiantum capillus-veneris]